MTDGSALPGPYGPIVFATDGSTHARGAVPPPRTSAAFWSPSSRWFTAGPRRPAHTATATW